MIIERREVKIENQRYGFSYEKTTKKKDKVES